MNDEEASAVVEPSWQSSSRAPRQVEAQRAVHAMHALVVPPFNLIAKPMETLPEARARPLHDDRLQRIDHGLILDQAIPWRPANAARDNRTVRHAR